MKKALLSALMCVLLISSNLCVYADEAEENSNTESITENINEIEGEDADTTINSPIVRAAVDSEKPVIDSSSISIDNTTVYYGDVVTIRVKVTDNDELDSVVLYLKNDSSSNLLSFLEMSYDDRNGLYEYSLSIDDSIPSGIWHVEELYAKDLTGNTEMQTYSETDGYCFNVISSDVDADPPILDLSSLFIDKTNVSNGEQVTIKIKANDNKEIESVLIYLKNIDTSQLLSFLNMSYDEGNDIYQYVFDIDDSISSGNWCVDEFYVVDTTGNYTIYQLEENECSFYVNNSDVDSEKPLIDSLSLSTLNAKSEDTVKISAKIIDNGEIDRVIISIYNTDTNQGFYYIPMTYNTDTDTYEYFFNVDDTIAIGHWVVSMQAYDIIGNVDIQSFYSPEYIIIVSDHGEDIHTWSRSEVTKQPTATEDGIRTYYCDHWFCGATKEEVIPATGESGNNSVEPDDVSSDNNITDDSSKSEANKPIVWYPSTPEEQKRYDCYGKEKVQYVIDNSSNNKFIVENAMQGSKCFEVFEILAGDYTIGRTYNIYYTNSIKPVYSTEEKVRLTLVIPVELRQSNRDFKMICVSEKGTPYVFEDLDNDPNTITIETNRFYAYALIYKDK